VKKKKKNKADNRDTKADIVPSPHDRFVKEVFSFRETARSFLIHYLPPEISLLLDSDSVELSKDTYIDSRLRSQFSDLLYNVTLTTGEDAHIYVLFEHKSQPDSLISWYLLSCMVRIWRQDMKMSKNKKLRAIIPIVLYHGKEEWTAGLNFQDLFEIPVEMKRFIPGFEYRFCNFQRYHDEPVMGGHRLRIALLLLKTIFRPDIKELLPTIFELIWELPCDQSGFEFLEAVLTYITSATNLVDEAYLGRLFERRMQNTGGEIMPTLVEKWIEKWRVEGMEKGSQRTARESVTELLEIRFGNRPPQILTWLNQLTDVPTLKGLLRQAATAHSIGEFEKFLESTVHGGSDRSSEILKS
jgi:predicted transposase/invertase (TIGR01784 family)